MEKASLKLGFEVRKGGEISQAGGQRILDSWSTETEKNLRTAEFTESTMFEIYIV